MPTCAMATGPGGRSYARMGMADYDRCPEGSQALVAGQFAMLAGSVRGADPPGVNGDQDPRLFGGETALLIKWR